MDSRRLIIFIVLSLGLLVLWEEYVAPKPKPAITAIDSKPTISSDVTFTDTSPFITVSTDLIQAQISTIGGNLQSLDLLKHGAYNNIKQPYSLLANNKDKTFIAQTGLVSNNAALPNHNSIFNTDTYNYTLKPEQNNLVVTLKHEANGIEVIKNYIFSRNNYTVNLSYQINNNTDKALVNISAYWRLLRDENPPQGEIALANTYTGAIYYDSQDKFNKISFKDLNKNKIEYPQTIQDGWVGFTQHYFSAVWLINPYGYQNVCANIPCRLDFKLVNNKIASSGLLTDLPTIAPHSNYTISMPLFVGPDDYHVLAKTAPELERVKDYGWVYIFATPLFWLLVKLYDLVRNWGWAIISLTLVVKLVLYPLTRASYISMAKMKVLGPKMEKLKAQYKDDKVKLQKSMMELYKSEKVNPIGGCLPMIMQIPVFIGLYWALLSSVELRNSSFLWLHDLSSPDPYYILPALLAISMFVQTFLSPPPADPIQAKMIRIMPIAFSIMFFFFPTGLVLYWLVNNILSMLQQWYVNKHVTLRRKNRQ